MITIYEPLDVIIHNMSSLFSNFHCYFFFILVICERTTILRKCYGITRSIKCLIFHIFRRNTCFCFCTIFYYLLDETAFPHYFSFRYWNLREKRYDDTEQIKHLTYDCDGKQYSQNECILRKGSIFNVIILTDKRDLISI